MKLPPLLLISLFTCTFCSARELLTVREKNVISRGPLKISADETVSREKGKIIEASGNVVAKYNVESGDTIESHSQFAKYNEKDQINANLIYSDDDGYHCGCYTHSQVNFTRIYRCKTMRGNKCTDSELSAQLFASPRTRCDHRYPRHMQQQRGHRELSYIHCICCGWICNRTCRFRHQLRVNNKRYRGKGIYLPLYFINLINADEK